jgi:mRNA deadenylase 3'-5' endonuclease subunit Ccr4
MARSFRIASYNVLANSYVKPEWYTHVPPEALRWDKRVFALAEKIAGLDADVVCLQEVEIDAYSLFESNLGAKGYKGVYAQKGNNRPDGCAVFFRQGALRHTGDETIYYHDGLGGEPDSGHLALVANFEFERSLIRVANTHLRWDRKDKSPEEHIGYRQIRELILNHIEIDRKAYAWVVCGDLNAQPDSPIVNDLIRHGFADAYAGHEQATSNPNRKAKRIDFIFHTSGLRATPQKLTRIDDLTPLPGADEPSDHLAVVAEFEPAV